MSKESHGRQGVGAARSMADATQDPQVLSALLSNLSLIDKNGKATRVGFRVEGDKKVRFAKTTGEAI